MGNIAGEPLPSLAVYNPALLKKDDLIAQFIARRPLLDSLVGELRRGGKTGYQHHMIIGPRGSGKTTLLRRLRYAIEDDAELYSRWLPLVFPEEQYNVARLSDLWVNCLDALSDTLGRGNRKNESESLDQRVDELPADDEKRRAQAALDLLVGWAKKEDRGLVLLFDNSDLLFDRLKSDHRLIREVFSADNRLLFIGAANAPIEATYDHEGAFYDFFKIHEMRGLTDQETREVIFNLARLRRTPHVIETLEREPGRIRALNLLTGGNLRTIVVLYQALARGKDDSIRADLEQLLDQYTPLYKHRFESLSALSQQVVDALALNWDPATAADLAEKLRLDTNAVSAVLNRLVGDGVVEKVTSPPGEKMFFQIAERFFNIWYLMRASRRVRRKLIWLVEFLKMFYGSAGLSRRARHLVLEPSAPEHDQSRRAELALLFAGAIEKPGLRRALEIEGVRSLMSCGTEDRQRLSSMLDLEGADASLKEIVERFQSLGELSERVEQTELWEQFAILLGFHLKRFDEAESAVRKAIELSPNKPAPWSGLGSVLCHLKRYEEAEAAFRKAIEVDPGSGWPWYNLGLMLQRDLKRYEDAEAAFRKAVELDPNEPLLWIVYGNLLAEPLKKYEDAEAVYRKAFEHNPNEPWQWIRYGNLLAEPLKKYEDAEAAYRKAIELNPDNLDISCGKVIDVNPDNLDISRALACILIKRGKWDEAVVYARKFIGEEDDEYRERNWPDIIGFFRDAVASGHADEAAALLDETEYGERWRPLREALRAIAEDDSSHLLRVAPEIRRPAEEIVAMLAPEGVRLGGAPKSTRARRTRRKRLPD